MAVALAIGQDTWTRIWSYASWRSELLEEQGGSQGQSLDQETKLGGLVDTDLLFRESTFLKPLLTRTGFGHGMGTHERAAFILICLLNQGHEDQRQAAQLQLARMLSSFLTLSLSFSHTHTPTHTPLTGLNTSLFPPTPYLLNLLRPLLHTH